MKKSNSSFQGSRFYQRVFEYWAFTKIQISGLFHPIDFKFIFDNINEYSHFYDKHTSGKKIDKLRVLEIGFGQRPFRLIALKSIGCDAIGVDVEQPMLYCTIAEMVAIWKRNGLERLIKTFVRHIIFDWKPNTELKKYLKNRGFEYNLDPSCFIVNDASSKQFSETIIPQSIDLIISEDVFEHINVIDLKNLVSNMRLWLKPGGVCLIRPSIFTGIVGGHDLDWYPHTLDSDFVGRRSEPWEHIRQNRCPANTYLNKLDLKGYRELFNVHFDIVDEVNQNPTWGKPFLTQEIKDELKNYTEEDLLANSVLFVLKLRTSN